MRGNEIAQLALGLFVPPLLILHLLASRGAALLDGFQPSYGWFMFVYWKQAPLNGLRQVLTVSAAWTRLTGQSEEQLVITLNEAELEALSEGNHVRHHAEH